MTKFSCECGIGEADHMRLKSFRLSAESNYREVFYWVPVCQVGHEMLSLCEECGLQEKAEGDLCVTCQRIEDVEAAEFRRDQVAETQLLTRKQA